MTHNEDADLDFVAELTAQELDHEEEVSKLNLEIERLKRLIKEHNLIGICDGIGI